MVDIPAVTDSIQDWWAGGFQLEKDQQRCFDTDNPSLLEAVETA
jgi:hypothetical protein